MMKDLKGLSVTELEEFAVSLAEKPFRGRQLFEWLYHRRATTFAEMVNIPAVFRRRLESEARIGALTLVDRQRSGSDGTTKLLFALEDGTKIESVLIPPRTSFRDVEGVLPVDDAAGDGTVVRAAAGDTSSAGDTPATERLTLCVSTQVGCPLDCVFCATATMGFHRNLSAGEIVDQVMSAEQIAGRKITNVVYMGMGEPLLNYDEVMKSVGIISTGLKITARRITISTAGWVPGIRRMADEKRRVKLAISLHSLDERAREELMPLTKKHSLADLLDAARYYYAATKQRITFEYILFDGWNDSDADVRRIVALLNSIPGKVNIIPFHSIAFSQPSSMPTTLRPASPAAIDAFAAKLRAGHVTTFVRSSSGEDINAACGQLAVGHTDRARRGGAPKPAGSAGRSRRPIATH